MQTQNELRSGFAVATSVTAQGNGGYLAELDGEYSAAGKINGGYLLAILARAAMLEDASHARASAGPGGPAGPDPRRPIAATVHYLTAPVPGPAQVEVTVVRRGRSISQVRARLAQEGGLRAEAFLTLGVPGTAAQNGAGTAAQNGGPQRQWWSDSTPVALPPEQECVQLPVQPPNAPFQVALMGVVEERLDPAVLGFAAGRPAGAGQLRGWVRIPGEPAVDAVGLLLVADALPPSVFDLGHLGWVPTLALTVHIHALPVPGPLRVRQQAHIVDGTLVSQVCDIWDEEGRLVAHSTQLATLPAA